MDRQSKRDTQGLGKIGRRKEIKNSIEACLSEEPVLGGPVGGERCRAGGRQKDGAGQRCSAATQETKGQTISMAQTAAQEDCDG